MLFHNTLHIIKHVTHEVVVTSFSSIQSEGKITWM